MLKDQTQGDAPVGEWDHVAHRLHEWRREAGEPSFTEIAARITRARAEAGSSPAAARVGRTTVYDAFRLGRTRINLALVREIGAALGADPDAIAAVEVAPLRPAPADAEASDAAPVDHAPTTPAPPNVSPPPAVVIPEPTEATTTDRWSRWQSLVSLMVVCLALNLLGREFVDLLNLPVYLDMVGTALAAIVLGPWRGAAVGLATNIVGFWITGPVTLPFAIVNVVGALVWGYGVHRFGMGRTLTRFFALTVAVAVTCTLMAAPILYFVYDGSIGHGQDVITANLGRLFDRFEVALTTSNLLTSVADKLISGFIALVGASALGFSSAGMPTDRR